MFYGMHTATRAPLVPILSLESDLYIVDALISKALSIMSCNEMTCDMMICQAIARPLLLHEV